MRFLLFNIEDVHAEPSIRHVSDRVEIDARRLERRFTVKQLQPQFQWSPGRRAKPDSRQDVTRASGELVRRPVNRRQVEISEMVMTFKCHS